jgi:DtxR family Mn-dependent transcriptional regulator
MTKFGPIAATTEAVDDYLKAILELSGPGEARVSSNALAAHLEVRAASVTGMLQKLAALEVPLVSYEKHRGVFLSPAGKSRALEVIRHHRLLERFLHDVLDYSWDEVHEEAERLEHYISERLEDRIAAKLGNPKTDPHGHTIPPKDGIVAERRETELGNWPCEVPACVSSVSDRDPEALREMKRLGLVPGATVLIQPGSRTGSVLVSIAGEAAIRLRPEVAEGVLVQAESPVK